MAAAWERFQHRPRLISADRGYRFRVPQFAGPTVEILKDHLRAFEGDPAFFAEVFGVVEHVST